MTQDDFAPEGVVRPQKAYKNLAFLNSPDARTIRVLCEFLEPQTRFERLNIQHTVVFFGSARTLPAPAAAENLAKAKRAIEQADGDLDTLQREYIHAQHAHNMSRYYEDAAALAERLTKWSLTLSNPSNRFVVCSGGGPGIMEAANRGAKRAGGDSIGLNISLPHEQSPNPYQTPELAFEFHYFFIRKFWFVPTSRGPRGIPRRIRTATSFFELITLLQTGAANNRCVILYGTDTGKKSFISTPWSAGASSGKDLNLFHMFDDVDTAFAHLQTHLTKHHL